MLVGAGRKTGNIPGIPAFWENWGIPADFKGTRSRGICNKASTEAQNQPHFPKDEVLLLLPHPSGSFESSFIC